MVGKEHTKKIPRSAGRSSRDENGSCWVIVLAGGSGERMKPTIHRWMGESRPKQYCTFAGTRSMVQHTLDRALALTEPSRIVTVIGRNHRTFFNEATDHRYMGTILSQPQDRGTAASVFHALAYIMELDPSATVVIFPSDHFVHPEARFLKHVKRACAVTREVEETLALLGACSSGPETDYGWIVPSETGLCPEVEVRLDSPRRVMGFHEKPSREKAVALHMQGGLWNTMVVSAQARTLWALGKQFIPHTWISFEAIREVLRGDDFPRLEDRMIALAGIYARMHSIDFSTDILQRATRQSVVLPMYQMEWCDWGKPERIMKSLTGLGLRPAFYNRPDVIQLELDQWRPTDLSEPVFGLNIRALGVNP